MSQELNKEELETSMNEKSSLMSITNGLERFTIYFNNILHKISSILLMFLMMLTAADVAGRYFFNYPIKGTYELTGLVLALLVIYSLGPAQLGNNHIEIDFFTKKMPNKIQSILRSVISFVLFIPICLTAWGLFKYSQRVWIGQETSGDLGLPLYIFSSLTILGALAFALTLLLDGLKALLKVVEK